MYVVNYRCMKLNNHLLYYNSLKTSVGMQIFDNSDFGTLDIQFYQVDNRKLSQYKKDSFTASTLSVSAAFDGPFNVGLMILPGSGTKRLIFCCTSDNATLFR